MNVKGIVHPEMMLSFLHPHVIPNPYCFYFCRTQRKMFLEMSPFFSFSTQWKVNGYQNWLPTNYFLLCSERK